MTRRTWGRLIPATHGRRVEKLHRFLGRQLLRKLHGSLLLPPPSNRPVPAPAVRKFREPWVPLPEPIPQPTVTAVASEEAATQPSPPPSPVRKTPLASVSLPRAADVPYIDLPPVVTRKDRKAQLMAAQQAINPVQRRPRLLLNY